MDHVNRCDTCAVSQSESCARAAHGAWAAPPSAGRKHALLKPREELRVLSTSCPGFLTWRPQSTLLCPSPQPDASREASPRMLESAKGLDPPEAAVRTPARLWLGTPEQGRTPRSMLVSGRRTCQGKRVGFVLFNSILARFVSLKYLEMAWRSLSTLLPRPCSCLGLHRSSGLNLSSGGLSPPKT